MALARSSEAFAAFTQLLSLPRGLLCETRQEAPNTLVHTSSSSIPAPESRASAKYGYFVFS